MGEVGDNISDALREWKIKFDEMNNKGKQQSNAGDMTSVMNDAMDALPEM